jgi:phage/plasmid-like protein (TIGR03299 family)
MAHDLNVRNGRVSFAFAGDRTKIWHGLGQQADMANWTLDDWIRESGLDYTAVLVPAYADYNGQRVNHGFLNLHSETAFPFAHVSKMFKNVQPRELVESFQRYIEHDDRFSMSGMGALGNGQRIFATAQFADFTTAGESFKAFLLSSTAFDGSSATTHRATMVRTVCRNTLQAAFGDKDAVISTRHSTQYNADKVARELETIVQSTERFRAMGDAMADQRMAKEVVSKLFKKLLEIPFDAKPDDVSSRKMNQFRDLSSAYATTVTEGAPEGTAWSALQAVTRYVDHDRSTRNGGEDEHGARFMSAQFGSGAQMKAEAVRLLTVDEDFGALFKSTFAPPSRGGDVTALLAAPFKPSRLQ